MKLQGRESMMKRGEGIKEKGKTEDDRGRKWVKEKGRKKYDE